MSARKMGSSPTPTTFKIHQVAMVGGEISPSLWYRHDLEKVQVSLAKCRNFIPMAEGGVTFRPGTWKVAETKNSGKVVLLSMNFSNEPSVIIEAGNQYFRFHVPGLSTIPEISTPYTLNDLENIRYVQSADTLFIVDGVHQPMVLQRHSNTNWAITPFSFENGPFLKENTTDTTLKLVPVDGSVGNVGQYVDVIASSSLFTASDVGRWIKIRYIKDGALITRGNRDYGAAGEINGPWNVDGKWKVTGFFRGVDATTETHGVELQYSIDGGTTWEVYDTFLNAHSTSRVTIEGELNSEDYNDITPQLRLRADGDTYNFVWSIRYVREEYEGLLKITSYTSSTSVRCEVMRKCLHIDRPTKRWSLGAWGNDPGWPAVTTFHQDRLTFARTPISPFDIWQSVTGDYYNFDIHYPVQDDDSIQIPIRSRSLDDIYGMISLKDLIVLTSGGEWRITGSAEGNAITPDSMYVSNQGYRGSSNIEPIIAGSSILFVQRFGTRIRDLAYSFESDGYDSTDITIFATHLFDGHTVVDWCYQQEPWSVVWVVRSDGALLGLTYMKEQNVLAWHKHETDGEVEAVSCASGSIEDEVYIVVKRSVNGVEKRYIEKISMKQEHLHLDSAVVAHDGSPATYISGLDHLEGKHVVVVADGHPIFNHIVSNGSITLQSPASFVVVGLGYTGTIQTLPMIYEAREGLSTGARRRAVEIILQLSESQKGFVGTDDENMYPINYPKDFVNYSGVVNEILSSEYDYAGQVTIEHRHPLPFTILTWTVKVAHGD
jgi:hypothetical protein